MFANLDLALTILQVASGLAGLTFVAIGFVPALLERAQSHYEAFIAQRHTVRLLRMTRLSFAAFVLTVLLALAWSSTILTTQAKWLLTCLGVGSLLTLVLGLGLAALIIFRYLQPDTFDSV